MLGIENDVARIAMNIVLDPIGLGLTFLTGGLSNVGKVAAATKALSSTKSILKGAKGVTAATRVNKAKDMLKLMGKVELNPAATAALKSAIEAKDTKAFAKAARALNKTPLPTKPGLFPTNRELHDLLKLEKAEKGLVAGIKGAGTSEQKLAQGLKGVNLDLGLGQVERLKRGQAAALQFRNPFTGAQTELVKGRSALAFMDKIIKPGTRLSPSAIAAAEKLGYGGVETLEEFNKAAIQGRFLKAEDLAITADQAKKGFVSNVVKELPAGNSPEALGKLLPFLREKTAIPVSVIENAGLTDEFAALGLKPKTVFAKQDGAALAKAMKAKQAGKAVDEIPSIGAYSQADVNKFLGKKGWLKAAARGKADLGSHFDDLRDLMHNSNVGLDVQYLKNYITHFWDVTDKRALELVKKMKKDGVMTSKRKFETFMDGMMEGHTMRFDNAFDIAEEYQKQVGRLIQDRQILQNMAKGRIMIDGRAQPLFATKKVVDKFGLDDDYVKASDPILAILNRSTAKTRLIKATAGAPEKTIRTKSLYIPKRLADDLEMIFSSPNTSEWAKRLTKFIATSKGLALSSSLFHSFALTESAISTLGIRKGSKAALTHGFGVPGLKKMVSKMGLKPDVDLLAIADDARLHRLNISKPSEVMASALDDGLQFIEGQMLKIPGMKGIVGAIPEKGRFGPRRYTEMFNKALWDDFHNPIKLQAWDSKWRALQKTNPNIPVTELKKEAADFINDAFGGQKWERLMVNPKYQQYLHWALLAPDWTVSNARIAGIRGRTPGKALEGLKGTMRGIVGKGLDPTEELTGAYWRNAIPAFLGTTALANYAMSGRYPWENPPGHKLDISLGTRDEKGREEFTKLGKQFREPLRWLTEADKIGGSKLSPAIQLITEQLSGHTTTGYATDLASKVGQRPMTMVEKIPTRLRMVVQKFIPFSVGGKNVFLALPRSSFTQTNAMTAIEDALRGTKGSGADADAVREILKLSLASGHDIARIKGMVRRNVGDPRGLLEQRLD
jgi:hypothetical protein